MRYSLLVAASLWTIAAHAAVPLGPEDARLLLTRTGFGASPEAIATFSKLSREEAVDQLLATTRKTAVTPPPAFATQYTPPPKFKDLSPEQRKAWQRTLLREGVALRAWWYQEMRDTPSPLTERMTLFWHNHFVSSQQKVRLPILMYRQNVLLRSDALGNFGTLLHEVSKDPAMLIYLDNASNHKGHANENFAREVMELFTVGIGHYREDDVREAARAFTGWGIDRASGRFRFYPRLHDDGEKTFLGRTGRFDGDDILDILLAQPSTAEFVVNKLWREFISPTPDPREVKRLAAVFRADHYEIKPLLHAMFTSNAFYAQAGRANLVKSPVELILGTLRTLDVEPTDWRPFVFLGRALGQDVFAPPNVKGWPGGDAWINSYSLGLRTQLIERLLRGPNPGFPMQEAVRNKNFLAVSLQRVGRFAPDVEAWADTPHSEAITSILLPAAPAHPIPAHATPFERLQAALLDPVYQLK